MSQDGCSTLREDAGKNCTLKVNECKDAISDTNGKETCLTQYQEWSCAEKIPLPPVNAEWIRDQVEIIENIDESACSDLIAQGCRRGELTCTDDGCTRDFHCGGKVATGCSTLEASGCTYLKEPSCNASVDETCQIKTGQMQCKGSLPDGVIEVGDAEIEDQNTVNVGGPTPNLSSCNEITDQFKNEGVECTQTSQVCVDKDPQIRFINGVMYIAPCWSYERVYECKRTQPLSTCTELAAEPLCKEVSRVCEVQSDNGCDEERVTYQCDGTDGINVGNAEFVDSYDKITGIVHVNSCSEFETNEICRKESETCVEEGGTKIVNGKPVTKDCWRYEIKYVCGSGTPAVCELYQ